MLKCSICKQLSLLLYKSVLFCMKFDLITLSCCYIVGLGLLKSKVWSSHLIGRTLQIIRVACFLRVIVS